jgi:Integrase zinc binding domain
LPSALFSDPRPAVDPGAHALAVDELPRGVSLEELSYEQERDPEISELFYTGGSGRNPVIYVNRDGIAILKAPLDGVEQILVPLALRPPVLYLKHNPKSVGHPGLTTMIRSMRKRYFWRKIYRQVEVYGARFPELCEEQCPRTDSSEPYEALSCE